MVSVLGATFGALLCRSWLYRAIGHFGSCLGKFISTFKILRGGKNGVKCKFWAILTTLTLMLNSFLLGPPFDEPFSNLERLSHRLCSGCTEFTFYLLH